MKSAFFLLILFPLFSMTADLQVGDRAVVIAPVVDCAGALLSDQIPPKELENFYQSFPSAPDKGYFGCVRIHQLKFNEIVKVLSTEGPVAECEVSNCYYLDRQGKKRKNFWLLKKYLRSLRAIEKKIKPSSIPAPIDMENPEYDWNKKTLSLVGPWFDGKTGYSAGTRFVRCPCNDSDKFYAIQVNNYARLTTRVAKIPKCLAVIACDRTNEQKRELFVRILNYWADPTDGFFSYVYGGTSFISRSTCDEFSLIFKKCYGRKTSFWQRKTGEYPQSGSDCSGMLLTAAQMAGISYFSKNTKALVHDEARLLKKGQKIEKGDFIYYSGHVMIVSDVEKNLLIEAIGYEAGYGKVQEIPLNLVFSHVRTYDDLLQAYRSKRFLKRLNSQGKPYRSVHGVKILKLM